MAKKNLSTKNDKTIYPEDKDWVNYTTNLNDGWADDVPLMYDEDKWSPDNRELTVVDLDDTRNMSLLDIDRAISNKDTLEKKVKKSDSPASSKTKSKDKSSSKKHEDDAEALSREERRKERRKAYIEANPSKQVKPFRLFIIVWAGLLLITMAILLGFFLDYLSDYQSVYEDTRPYHTMCGITQAFNNDDYDLIYNYITAKPELTEFETKDNVENYMRTVVADADVCYEEIQPFNEEFPRYYISGNGYILGQVELRKDPNKFAKYKFPVWYVSNFEFYTEAQHSAIIEVPDNYSVSINGVALSDEYVTKKNIPLEAQDYYKDYATLPTMKRFKVENLYERPEITAYDSQGSEVEVTFNESTGVYEAPLGTYLEDADDAKEFAIKLISDYTNYISGDVPDNALDNYFIPESDMLYLINSGTYRRFFNSHSKAEINNEKVTDFVVYNKDAVFVRVYLEQTLYFTASETGVNEVDLGVYLIRTDKGWKACTIQY